MPYNPPPQRGEKSGSAGKVAANHSVAVLLLGALIALVVLRHVYGVAALSVGTR
jgi:hypothetical protein